jgi:hypothetical protein
MWRGSAGRVCAEFNDIHSQHAHKMLEQYHIGEMVEGGDEAGPDQARKVCLPDRMVICNNHNSLPRCTHGSALSED